MAKDYRLLTKKDSEFISNAFISAGIHFDGKGSYLHECKTLNIWLDMGAAVSIPLKNLPAMAEFFQAERIYVNGTLAYDAKNPPSEYYFI